MFKTNDTKWFLVSALIASVLHFNTAWAEKDFEGSQDHPKIPRVSDTVIVGFSKSSYDEGKFMTGATGNKLDSRKIEGKRTRIMYLGPEELSPLGALRNYQKAFADLGEVEEIYTCKGNDCFSNLGEIFTWRKSNRLPNNLGENSSTLPGFVSFKDQIYWYGKIKTAKSFYHISIYSALMSYSKNWGYYEVKRIQNKPLIHLDVVEVTDFKPTLEVVTAKDMSKKISEKGHIALYGIHFDFDSDLLKPESNPALEEIAKALKADKSLNIYVVGHTDNKGTLEYNKNLSKRRANAVVKKLSTEYGIESSRLTPEGVGLAAPIATNKTEEGRTLNRRVELVERQI